MAMIKSVTPYQGKLMMDAVDNETWQLDPTTGQITPWDDDDSGVV